MIQKAFVIKVDEIVFIKLQATCVCNIFSYTVGHKVRIFYYKHIEESQLMSLQW